MDTQAALAGRTLRKAMGTPKERRWAREYMGLSQSQLCAVVHVHRVTISRWEAGTRQPSGIAALEYAEFLSLARQLRREELEEEGDDE